jgi:hypothetical protein
MKRYFKSLNGRKGRKLPAAENITRSVLLIGAGLDHRSISASHRRAFSLSSKRDARNWNHNKINIRMSTIKSVS